jgi:hypothetical protein
MSRTFSRLLFEADVPFSLQDLLSTSAQVQAGTVLFDDGTSITFGELVNTGAGTYLNLSTPVTTTSIKVTITKLSSTTTYAGLAEIEVYAADSSKFVTKLTPTVAPVTTAAPTSTSASSTAVKASTTTKAGLIKYVLPLSSSFLFFFLLTGLPLLSWFLAPLTAAKTTAAAVAKTTAVAAIVKTSSSSSSSTTTTTAKATSTGIVWTVAPLRVVAANPKAASKKRHWRDFKLADEE